MTSNDEHETSRDEGEPFPFAAEEEGREEKQEQQEQHTSNQNSGNNGSKNHQQRKKEMKENKLQPDRNDGSSHNKKGQNPNKKGKNQKGSNNGTVSSGSSSSSSSSGGGDGGSSGSGSSGSDSSSSGSSTGNGGKAQDSNSTKAKAEKKDPPLTRTLAVRLMPRGEKVEMKRTKQSEGKEGEVRRVDGAVSGGVDSDEVEGGTKETKEAREAREAKIAKEAAEESNEVVGDEESSGSDSIRLTEVLCDDNSFRTVPWGSVRVGHVVRVSSRESFPADLFMLTSSSDNKDAYIQTGALNGDMKLMMRKPVPALSQVGKLFENDLKLYIILLYCLTLILLLLLLSYVQCHYLNNVIIQYNTI